MFDEELLSGYLDGELTQAERQRVRLRLEDDPRTRELLEEMAEIREAARSTHWIAPGDEEWDERPRTRSSRWMRRSGWVVIGAWVVALVGLAVWGLVVGPATWWEKALATAVVGGPLLLLGSVLADRIAWLKNDRYRRVKK